MIARRKTPQKKRAGVSASPPPARPLMGSEFHDVGGTDHDRVDADIADRHAADLGLGRR